MPHKQTIYTKIDDFNFTDNNQENSQIEFFFLFIFHTFDDRRKQITKIFIEKSKNNYNLNNNNKKKTMQRQRRCCDTGLEWDCVSKSNKISHQTKTENKILCDK